VQDKTFTAEICNKLPQLPLCSFYFMRHGQTDWNKAHRAMGITDIPLNAYGISQAEESRSLLVDHPIKTICHSPLQRAKQTAEIIKQDFDCNMIAIKELKEFNVGAFAGQVIGKWFDEWMNGTILPEAETYVDFIIRSLHGVRRALQPEGPVLIVSHGGTYWAIQQALKLLSLPDLPNCEPVFFDAPATSGKEWRCINLNRPDFQL